MLELSEVSRALVEAAGAMIRGDAQHALMRARHAGSIEPDNPLCHASIADALVNLGRREEALEEIQIALRLAPTEGVILCTAIRVYRDAHRFDLALQVADRAVKSDEKDREAWRLRGHLHLWHGSIVEALRSAERAIELSSLKYDPRASHTAAFAYGLLGRWHDANRHFVLAGPEERRWGWFARRRHVFDVRWRRLALRLVLWMQNRVVAMGASARP